MSRRTTALVTGASGFIGRWVVRELRQRGIPVIAQVRDAARGRALHQEEIVVADLATPGSATRLVREVKPAVVYNLAGYGVARDERDEATALRLNVELVRELAVACAPPAAGEDAPRLVHAGSAAEYGATQGALDEGRDEPPTSLYGATKWAGTAALRAVSRDHGTRALCARLFTVVGDGEHAGRLLPTLRAAAQTRDPIPLSAGTQERDFAWVGDAARVLVDLAMAPWEPGTVVNVASGRMHTVRAFVEAVARQLHIDAARLQFGAVPTLPGDGTGVTVPVDRLRQLVGDALPDDLTHVVQRAVSPG